MALQAPEKLEFLRYEFKYILSYAECVLIEKELQRYMVLDPFVRACPENYYDVRSLYFDDLIYTCYYDKIDGIKKREKFRLRTYTTDYDEYSDTFLEMKGRVNAVTYKHRTPLKQGNVGLADLSENETIAHIIERAGGGQVAEVFRRKGSHGVRPVMVIDYKRRPYIYPYDPDFRVTLDSDLKAKPGYTLHSKIKRTARSILKGYTIMEVKTLSGIPSWFADIICRYQLQRISISKIVAGMNVWEITPHLE